MLYARISMYSEDGRCWASNAHFAEKHKVTIRCVQNWLKQLVDNGYIEVEIEKGGFQTKRNIWITTDFKKSYTKRTTVHPPVKYSSPPPEAQFTSNIETNIKEININPPPLSSIKKEEEDSSIEDFSFLNSFGFGKYDLEKLKKFPAENVKKALDFALSKEPKSLIGFLLDSLRNPDKYKSNPTDNLSENQRLALIHNDFIKNLIDPKHYNKNIKVIKEKGYFWGFCNKGGEIKIACGKEVAKKILLEDIKISCEGVRKAQKST